MTATTTTTDTAKREQAKSLQIIDKGIKLVATNSVKLNTLIHETAILCATHAKTYGDTDRCARLVDAMPMSFRRSLLIDWFEAFTAVGIGKDNKTGNMKAHLRGKTEERDALWNIEAGKATPFFAMPKVENEPDVPTYESIHDNVVAFIGRMEKKAAKIEDNAEQTKALNEIAQMKAVVA